VILRRILRKGFKGRCLFPRERAKQFFSSPHPIMKQFGKECVFPFIDSLAKSEDSLIKQCQIAENCQG
jgi:hypothetical protein